MKILMLLLLMTVSTCFAQTSATPTIKGHTLGESLQKFISESNDATREQIANCASGNGAHKFVPYECTDVNQAVNTGNGKFHCDLPMYQTGICRDFRGNVTFYNNKLVELNLEITDEEWNQALADVTSKFGKPDEVHSDKVQNAYGATFNLQAATWAKSDYLVVAFEKINAPYNLKVFTEVILTTRSYNESQEKKKEHSNALN